MKLLNESQFITDEEKILTLLNNCSVSKDNVTFTKDGVNIDCSINLSYHVKDRLPFKFNEVNGDFKCLQAPLSTFEGFPKIIRGDCVLGSPNSSKITSLVGINNVVEFIGPIGRASKRLARFTAPFSKITEGGLGLVLIDGKFTFESLGYDLPSAFEIIQRYLGRPDDIFHCQNELIEAGLEEYAKL